MRTSILPLASLLALVGGDGLATDRYVAQFDPETDSIRVEACFVDSPPRRLYRHSKSGAFTDWLRAGDTPIDDRVGGARLLLPDLPDDSCIDWQVDLGKAADSGDYRTAFRRGETIAASTSLWFWRGPYTRPIEVEVRIPEGFSFSTPWSRGDGANRYIPAPTPSSWSSRTAIGPFQLRRLRIGDSAINVALAGNLEPSTAEKLVAWVSGPIESVAGVFGYFPAPSVQVLIVPIGARQEAVPWAHVIRGGGPAVEFFVDQSRPLTEFRDDWTATHEFSHLLLPYVSRRDRWLSEGLASYYQNVLQARDGRLGEAQAWQKLHEGFQRGRRGTRDETLAEATQSGRDSVMRVYWSGAAMMLRADMRLRELTGGRHSLDTALRALDACCDKPGRVWRARDLMQELDRLTGTGIFSGLYADHVFDDDFPETADIYRQLGLETNRGRVRLVADAPLADIRRDIMAPAAGASMRVPTKDNAP